MRLSHIAIACPDILSVAAKLKSISLEVEATHDVPSEKVKASFIPIDGSKAHLELLEPMGSDSPISKFLQRRPGGGLHHLCFEVSQLERWHDRLIQDGIEVLPPGIRKSAKGRALFIHPRSMGGVLVELEEI